MFSLGSVEVEGILKYENLLCYLCCVFACCLSITGVSAPAYTHNIYASFFAFFGISFLLVCGPMCIFLSVFRVTNSRQLLFWYHF